MTMSHAHVRGAARGLAGLLFDKDGTILDYWKTWIPINHEVTAYAARGDVALKRRMLAKGGHDPDTDIVVAGSIFAGGPMDAIVDMMRAEAGAAAPTDLYETTARLFREGGARNAVLIDGAAAAIETLADRGYILGVATNDTAAGLDASLARSGILPRFVFTCGCDSGHGSKPGPGMVHGFCDAVALAPSAVAVIGDSRHDLEMGRAAGVGLNIAVLSGTSSRADLAPHADVVLDSVADLPAFLAEARA